MRVVDLEHGGPRPRRRRRARSRRSSISWSISPNSAAGTRWNAVTTVASGAAAWIPRRRSSPPAAGPARNSLPCFTSPFAIEMTILPASRSACSPAVGTAASAHRAITTTRRRRPRVGAGLEAGTRSPHRSPQLVDDLGRRRRSRDPNEHLVARRRQPGREPRPAGPVPPNTPIRMEQLRTPTRRSPISAAHPEHLGVGCRPTLFTEMLAVSDRRHTPARASPDVRFAFSSLAAGQLGLVTRKQVLDAGISVHTLHDWVRRRRLEPARRGVYRVAGAPTSWEQSLLVACLSGGSDSHVFVPGRGRTALGARIPDSIAGDHAVRHTTVDPCMESPSMRARCSGPCSHRPSRRASRSRPWPERCAISPRSCSLHWIVEPRSRRLL